MSAMNYAQVASLYDIYVTMEFDIPFFLQEAQSHAKVLELMAGTGRVSLPLLRAGVNLTCVDSSPLMLDRLRQKLHTEGLTADVHEMDICNLALGATFDLILIPFHSFAEITFPTDQRAALRAIRNHLPSTGRFICTLHNPPIRLKSVDGFLHLRGKYSLHEQPGTLMLWSLENYHPTTRLITGMQFYELYDASGLLTSRSFIDIQFYLHTYREFEQLVTSEGFTVQAVYGDYSRSPFYEQTSPVMLWVLQTS